MPKGINTETAPIAQEAVRKKQLDQIGSLLSPMEVVNAWALLDVLVEMQSIDAVEAWHLISDRIVEDAD
jgi:hypothetical protein